MILSLFKKTNHGAFHFSVGSRKQWTEAALERDAARRKEEGRESQPLSNRDLNYHIEEKEA